MGPSLNEISIEREGAHVQGALYNDLGIRGSELRDKPKITWENIFSLFTAYDISLSIFLSEFPRILTPAKETCIGICDCDVSSFQNTYIRKNLIRRIENVIYGRTPK